LYRTYIIRKRFKKLRYAITQLQKIVRGKLARVDLQRKLREKRRQEELRKLELERQERLKREEQQRIEKEKELEKQKKRENEEQLRLQKEKERLTKETQEKKEKKEKELTQKQKEKELELLKQKEKEIQKQKENEQIQYKQQKEKDAELQRQKEAELVLRKQKESEITQEKRKSGSDIASSKRMSRTEFAAVEFSKRLQEVDEDMEILNEFDLLLASVDRKIKEEVAKEELERKQGDAKLQKVKEIEEAAKDKQQNEEKQLQQAIKNEQKRRLKELGESDAPISEISPVDKTAQKKQGNKFKIVIVGSRFANSSQLLAMLIEERYLDANNTHLKRHYIRKQEFQKPFEYSNPDEDNKVVEVPLEIIDWTANIEANDFLETNPNAILNFKNADVFAILFSVMHPEEFHDVQNWYKVVRKSVGYVPIVLVGTNIELRPNVTLPKKVLKNQPINYAQGFDMSARIKAEKYIEISVKKLEDVKSMFQEAVHFGKTSKVVPSTNALFGADANNCIIS